MRAHRLGVSASHDNRLVVDRLVVAKVNVKHPALPEPRPKPLPQRRGSVHQPQGDASISVSLMPVYENVHRLVVHFPEAAENHVRRLQLSP